MAKIIVIAGDTGSGKSTSFCNIDLGGIKIQGLSPEDTFLFNVVGKEIPTIGGNAKYKPAGTKGGRRLDSSNYMEMSSWIDRLKDSPLKNIIVDDAQYLMSMDFFNSRNEDGFKKYARIGFSFIDLIVKLKSLPDSMMVFILIHTDEYKDGENVMIKLKTIGKMLDEKFTLAGLFSTVLVARKKWDKIKKQMKYYFSTVPEFPSDIAKSPLGMFIKEGKILKEVPNDLGYIRECAAAFFSGDDKSSQQ